MSLSKAEAQLALANDVARVYRVYGVTDFSMLANPNTDGCSVNMEAYFPDLPATRFRSVNVALTAAGWNIYIEQQWVHEFSHVLRKRLEVEAFARQYAEAQTRKVIDGYR
ncbi:hypothetical protein [Thermomonas carbonis]|uniref:Uncharacterized protein n=1 Tax=Thermomonas carbonis TaxID=1463158 RepID=A0A7G9SR85_9GAMM|nr:hypothetical protein [Thermomonas carbonis]QNN70360.1 hypothetical protein H9L16_01600 [Thermomonas carbonis]GHB99504.1 hypothetical protein GCM10010080_10430 [Thermomonas carbonis]